MNCDQEKVAIGMLEQIAACLCHLATVFTPRLSATLTLHGGHHHHWNAERDPGDPDMPLTIAPGKPFTSTYQEWSGPNGTGNPLPPAGPVTYTSSDATVATVDPNTGAGTAQAAGTATITATDSTNSLTASDTLTVSETAQSATLTLNAA